MAFYFDTVRGGFYCDALHGARTLKARDPAWTATGEQTDDDCPLIDRANPACSLPPAADLVSLSEDTYRALMDGQSQGKRIVVSDGQPALVDPPPPTSEQIAAGLRAQRDALLAPVSDALQRHLLQTTYRQPTTLTDTQAATWATYAQALRDVPQQSGFPASVVWPEPPAPIDPPPATPEA